LTSQALALSKKDRETLFPQNPDMERNRGDKWGWKTGWDRNERKEVWTWGRKDAKKKEIEPALD